MTDKIQLESRDGQVFLYGEEFDLKIDSNRNVYARKHEAKEFSRLVDTQNNDKKISQGYSAQEKKYVLLKLYSAMKEKLESQDNTSEQSKPQGEKA